MIMKPKHRAKFTSQSGSLKTLAPPTHHLRVTPTSSMMVSNKSLKTYFKDNNFIVLIIILLLCLNVFCPAPVCRGAADHVTMSRIAYFKRKYVEDDDLPLNFRSYRHTVS